MESELESESGGGVGSNAAKWEATAAEREASLKRRKEEMVLAARKKLLEKQAKAKALAEAAE